MPLTDAHRKLLWARSGGWCAICRCSLTQDETAADPAAIIGMEAHIVSEQPGGPRYRPMQIGEVDHYLNIILLCPNDHVRVDRQPGSFTESKLLEIKADHERWAKQRWDRHRPVHLRDSKPGAPIPLYRATKGADVIDVVGNSHAFQYDKPNDLTEDEVELLGGFLQDVNDWMDIWGDIGPAGHLRAELEVGQRLDELHRAGLVVYVGSRNQILEGGTGSPSRWQCAVLTIHRSATEEARQEIVFVVATG